MSGISEGTGSAPTKVRLFDSDVAVRKVSLPFQDKNYDILVATTAYGDLLYGGTSAVMLARNCNEQSARKYITETVNRNPALNHNEVSIIDHLQDLKQLSYKYHRNVYFTYEGVRTIIEASQSKHVVQNRDKILDLLKKAHVSATSAIHVATSGVSGRPTQLNQDEQEEESNLNLALCPVKSSFSTTGEFETAVGMFFSLPKIKEIEEKIHVLEKKWLRESILVSTQAKKTGKIVYGYVYALSNPLFPEMLKIGATFRTPEIRARELSGTGTPEPFVVVAELKCRDPFGIEREVHHHFSGVRTYGRRKEFFSLAVNTVRGHFQSLKEKAMSNPSITRAEQIEKRLKRMKKWQHSVAPKHQAEEKDPSTPQASAPEFTPSYSMEGSSESRMEDPITIRALPVVQGENHVEALGFEDIVLKLMSSVNDMDTSALREKLNLLLDTRKQMLDLDYKEFELSELKKKEASGNSKKRALEQNI